MSVHAFDASGNPLSDTDLIAKIIGIRDAIHEQSVEGVGVIAGEGRRVEYTSSNVGLAKEIMRDLLVVARQRNLQIGGDAPSIMVRY